MTWRRQLAVASPISIAAVARAAFDSAFAAPNAERANALIGDRFGARAVVTTDSGTSALVLALRLAVPRDGVIGFPGYACVDLAAAALFAGVRVRLYDLDPATLSPDLASVEDMLRRGVDAVVVAHLFGYPADVGGVRDLASRAGVPVIEDAAQSAGGSMHGRPLGSLGDLSLLSFGRGKGVCAGGGGALLGFGSKWEAAVQTLALQPSGRGWRGLATTSVQWGLGRPSLYAIPSMIPGLHLGEMVYHPAGEPAAMSGASISLVRSALDLSASAVSMRRSRAESLRFAAQNASQIAITKVLSGAAPGFLRFPVRDISGGRNAVPSLGIVRPYPQTLAEQPQLSPILLAGEPAGTGAIELRRTLVTLPTHHLVSRSDIERIGRWFSG